MTGHAVHAAVRAAGRAGCTAGRRTQALRSCLPGTAGSAHTPRSSFEPSRLLFVHTFEGWMLEKLGDTQHQGTCVASPGPYELEKARKALTAHRRAVYVYMVAHMIYTRNGHGWEEKIGEHSERVRAFPRVVKWLCFQRHLCTRITSIYTIDDTSRAKCGRAA